jgi:hypothetical protein
MHGTKYLLSLKVVIFEMPHAWYFNRRRVKSRCALYKILC